MSVSVHIPQFEGPLALLLHLIRQKEMDILDIDIHLITSEYLGYIKKMKQFDLEVAGDFIAMAATLIQIKSKMLLPDSEEEQEDDEQGDPRDLLVKKLLEYRLFQSAGKKLYDYKLLGRDVYKPSKKNDVSKKEENQEILLQENALFSLATHYMKALHRIKKTVHRVTRKTRSLADRIYEIRDYFLVDRKIKLSELLGKGRQFKEEMVITLLSCLELSKLGFVSMTQLKQYGEIYLIGKKPFEKNITREMEDYGGNSTE